MSSDTSQREGIEVLASDFLAKLRSGESPDIEDYADRFPALAEEIRDLFPAVLAAEQMKRAQADDQRSPQGRQGQETARLSLDAREQPGSEGVPAFLRRPYPGLALGKYTLQERIGRGSLGSVWRAEHPEFGIPVAIKVLHPKEDCGIEEEQRFLREVRAAALLGHPHVIRMFDAGIDHGLRYMVMEYAEGGTVAQLLAREGGKLDPGRAVSIAVAIARAMEAAAELHIIHRDIKPENILLDRNGKPKLADLGLAKELSNVGNNVTRTGVALGTPLYIAPEQAIAKGKVDGRADIYSLGATLYHLLTGEPPFDGASPYEIVQAHLHQELVDPRDRNPDIPRQLSAVVCKMLRKAPDERYQTATDLRLALSWVGSDSEADAGAMSSGRSRKVWLWGAFAALVLLAIASAVRTVARQLREGEGDSSEASVSRMGAGAVAKTQEAEPPATGNLRMSDWQAQGASSGSTRPTPTPIGSPHFHVRSGVLEFAGADVERARTVIYGTTYVPGPFRAKIVARNLETLGIAGPPGTGAPCKVSLFAADDPRQSDGAWHTIALERGRDGVRCTVDGTSAPSIGGSQFAPGRIWLCFRRGVPGAIQTFLLEVDEEPRSERLPAPRRGGFGP